jgi:hypothetical protein
MRPWSACTQWNGEHQEGVDEFKRIGRTRVVDGHFRCEFKFAVWQLNNSCDFNSRRRALSLYPTIRAAAVKELLVDDSPSKLASRTIHL